MATYYVSPYGSDSNNGLGPDPTAATNKPLLTLGKAISNVSPKATAGDTVIIAPGVYREAFQLGPNGSSGNTITVSGDPGNAQGFKDGSGVLVSPGEIRWGWVAANDTTQPTINQTCVYAPRSYYNFSNIWFLGYGAAGALVSLSNGTNVSFTTCMFSIVTAGGGPTTGAISITNSSNLVLNHTFDRCIFIGHSYPIFLITLAKTSTGAADYNANILIQNSLFLGGSNQVSVTISGTGTYTGGGITLQNCTMLGNGTYAVLTGAGVSTTAPVAVYNCVFSGGSASLGANASGQIVEDYNLLNGTSNIATPTHSTVGSACAPLLDFGQAILWGQTPRPIGTPTIGSPLLGFGNATGAPVYDFTGRARPEGGQSLGNGIGWMERHDTAVLETSVVDSGTSIRIDGPGSHEFVIPVDAVSTTISVKCQYDTNHGTTYPPQAIIPGEAEIGVSAQTITASATTGSWITLAFTAFTPAAKGVVRVQLVARPSAANGKCYFDTFAIS